LRALAQVRDWQAARRKDAQEKGYVTTILGRRRQLPDARISKNRGAQSHALRAAINTPIQGSAADIATAAMLRINEDPTLQELGWRLLLQVGVRGARYVWASSSCLSCLFNTSAHDILFLCSHPPCSQHTPASTLHSKPCRCTTR
jgi:hypothetical protein